MNNAIIALNDLNRVLKNVLPAETSSKDSATAIDLIFRSVADRYTGLLRSNEDHNGNVCYRPSDGEEIHEILTDLWGEYLPATLRVRDHLGGFPKVLPGGAYRRQSSKRSRVVSII